MAKAITRSPKLLSDIIGAGQIGDLLIQVVEFGEAGEYDLGQIVSLDASGRVVHTVPGNVDDVYGVIAEERVILEIASERLRGAQVIRRGSLNADELEVDSLVNLRTLSGRLRELGIFLEGVEASLAAPFRIRNINPSSAESGTADVVVRVHVDGSIDNTAEVLFGGNAIPTTVLDFSQADCTIPNTGAVRIVRISVRQGAFTSNSVNFAVLPPAGP